MQNTKTYDIISKSRETRVLTGQKKKVATVAQSVERRLGKAEVGGSSPLGSLMKIACRQRVLDILWRHAVFVKTEIFACLYKKKKPGYHRRLKKGGKVYMKKLFALYAYNIGEKCE